MNAHYLQHVSFEGLGSIESWLEASGYKITKTQFFKSPNLPEPDEIDLLIVMGGPMSGKMGTGKWGQIYLCGRARSCSPAGVKPAPEGWPTTG